MPRWLFPLALLLFAPLPAFAQQPAPKADPAAELRDYIKAHYTKLLTD